MSRRGLQAVLTGIGGVATLAGARGVLRGTAEVIQGGAASANIDSEYRFYSSWYNVFGLLLLGAVRRPETEATLVRACAAGFLVASCGRVLSIRSHGRPHAFQLFLTGLEFAIPPVIVPWQAKVARDSRGSSVTRTAAVGSS